MIDVHRLRIPTVLLIFLSLFLLTACAQAEREEVFDKAKDTFNDWDRYSLETTMTLGSGDSQRTFELNIHYDSEIDERYVEYYLLEDNERLLLFYLYAKDDAVYHFNDTRNQQVDDEDEYRIHPRSQFESEMPKANRVIVDTLEMFPGDLEEIESTIRGDAFTFVGEASNGEWLLEGDADHLTIETTDPRAEIVTVERSDFFDSFDGIDEQRHIDWMNENS